MMWRVSVSNVVVKQNVYAGDSVQRALMLVVCGLLVSACSNIPGQGGEPAKIQFQSNPVGAEASLASGGSCKTPCALPAPDKTGAYAVIFSLTGYYPETVGVHVTRDKPNWYASETVTIDPNPVSTMLQPAKPARQPR
jgi:hypothetical protein